MTYFHIRMHTIIGAKSFHCPVRDGKEWGQLAMVVRHNRCQESGDRNQVSLLTPRHPPDAFGRSKAVF
jgi:hypothetical protein